LTGAAAILRHDIAAPLSPAWRWWLERDLEPARQALGLDAAGAELVAGEAMTPEQAVAYALEEDGD
jgi:hypothetical protein